MPAGRVRDAEFWLAALVVANVLILLGPRGDLRTLGGLMLFCVIPGQGLIALAVPGSGRGAVLRRLLLGMAASYLISNLLTLALTAIPGAISLVKLLVMLDVTTVALWGVAVRFRRTGAEWDDDPENKTTWLYAGILLAVLCASRFSTFCRRETFKGLSN